MEWLVWLVIAWFVGRRIFKSYGDAQKTMFPNQSAEDNVEPGSDAQADRGSQRPVTSWSEIKRMGHERGKKDARDGGFEAKGTAIGNRRYKPESRYKKKPSPLSKKRRKSKVKVRAGWFS